MKKAILDLTKQLIRFASVKENQKELNRIVSFCEKFLRQTPGIKIRRFSWNNKPSLVAVFGRTKKPKIFLVGHLDVIEGDKEQFVPVKKGDRLYGRGAFDMKGSDAVMMLVMKKITTLKPKPSVGIMLTTDEESGGFWGTKYLLEDQGYSCNVAFVPDGGNNFKIITSEKGIIHFKLISKGKSAHASRPWAGKSAIDKLIEAYQKLKKEFPNPKNKKDWRISLVLGKIRGGDATNKVPDWAEGYFDLRYPEKYNQRQIIKKIKTIVKELRLEVIVSGSYFSVSENNLYIQKYKKVAEKILKRRISFEKHPAASDARFFTKKRIPVILTAPKGANSHAKDEWVSVASLEKLYNIVFNFVQSI